MNCSETRLNKLIDSYLQNCKETGCDACFLDSYCTIVGAKCYEFWKLRCKERIKMYLFDAQFDEWVPVTLREATEEEKLDSGLTFVLTCPLPEDRQTILVTRRRIGLSGSSELFVEGEECWYDGGLCRLVNDDDWESVIAWMPAPEPYALKLEDMEHED